jgi:hypothetical protein
LIDRLERSHPALSELVPGKPQRGIVTGLNAAFVIDGATRSRLLDRDPRSVELIRPLVKGRDLRPFAIDRADRYVLLVGHGTAIDDYPAIRKHLATFRTQLEARKPGTYRWYELQDPLGPLVVANTPRLLYQDIQTQPACAFDDGSNVPDTTVWMLPTVDRVILAILNSSLYHWYARRRFPPALNGAVRPKQAYIAKLPIARPSPDLRRAIEATTDRSLLDTLIAEAYELSRAERDQIISPS